MRPRGRCCTACRIGAGGDGFEVVDRLGAGVYRGTAGQAKYAQHLHRPVAALGGAVRAARQHGTGGGEGVDDIGLLTTPQSQSRKSTFTKPAQFRPCTRSTVDRRQHSSDRSAGCTVWLHSWAIQVSTAAIRWRTNGSAPFMAKSDGVGSMTRLKRVRLGVCALLAAATATACGSQSSTGSTVDGVLQGKLVTIGGPGEPPGGSPHTQTYPNANDRVAVIQHGKTIDTTRTSADGSFRFTLHPGTYGLQGSDGCTGTVTVVIKPEVTTTVSLSCQAP